MKRVIAAIVVKDGLAVQSIGFARYLPVGRPEIAARFFDSWDADEVLLVDIDATCEGRLIDLDMVRRVAAEIHCPLAVGGGIRSGNDIRALLNAGADKVVIASEIAAHPGLLTAEAARFGAQCLIACVDYRTTPAGPRAFARGGRANTGIDPVTLATRHAAAGAGEILLHSIDRDGARAGYDLAMARSVGAAVTVPVICLGGAGHPGHVRAALALDGVSAVAIGNMLNYTEHAIATIKAWLADGGVPVRLDTPADYRGTARLADGRLARLPDAVLEAQIFERAPEYML
ncbi:MAG: imidazole glycerol phosphate synthase subunit HisF [Alphaproteobacteria bacterium]|nr:imidazole glycerol phosphate synthase subunit HisF [Alphaproteobacteria bacterium]